MTSETNHLATIDDMGHTDPLTLDQCQTLQSCLLHLHANAPAHRLVRGLFVNVRLPLAWKNEDFRGGVEGFGLGRRLTSGLFLAQKREHFVY